ncbi:uncharacterized protein BdWA1_003552 [Babesia duncani]|nr:hypothetical protein BdWA1_004088 [Babesia duncani]KAK2194991.1 hypothetical protein BdWA1_003552 [Babesia duncani]
MFTTPYAVPCKLSIDFSTGQAKQYDMLRLSNSKELLIEYSKLRVFRFTRNLNILVGTVCRMGLLPAAMYSLASCIHTHKMDLHGALADILRDEFIQVPNSPNNVLNSSSSGGAAASPNGEKAEQSNVEDYVGRVLCYSSYLRFNGAEGAPPEHPNPPLNNIITCIIDASAEASTLGKLKTCYQPWF